MKSCNGNYVTTLHYKWYSLYLLDDQETIPYTSYKEFPTSERSATKVKKYMLTDRYSKPGNLCKIGRLECLRLDSGGFKDRLR
jgi:hypothetical protein